MLWTCLLLAVPPALVLVYRALAVRLLEGRGKVPLEPALERISLSAEAQALVDAQSSRLLALGFSPTEAYGQKGAAADKSAAAVVFYVSAQEPIHGAAFLAGWKEGQRPILMAFFWNSRLVDGRCLMTGTSRQHPLWPPPASTLVERHPLSRGIEALLDRHRQRTAASGGEAKATPDSTGVLSERAAIERESMGSATQKGYLALAEEGTHYVYTPKLARRAIFNKLHPLPAQLSWQGAALYLLLLGGLSTGLPNALLHWSDPKMSRLVGLATYAVAGLWCSLLLPGAPVLFWAVWLPTLAGLAALGFSGAWVAGFGGWLGSKLYREA